MKEIITSGGQCAAWAATTVIINSAIPPCASRASSPTQVTSPAELDHCTDWLVEWQRVAGGASFLLPAIRGENFPQTIDLPVSYLGVGQDAMHAEGGMREGGKWKGKVWESGEGKWVGRDKKDDREKREDLGRMIGGGQATKEGECRREKNKSEVW